MAKPCPGDVGGCGSAALPHRLVLVVNLLRADHLALHDVDVRPVKVVRGQVRVQADGRVWDGGDMFTAPPEQWLKANKPHR